MVTLNDDDKKHLDAESVEEQDAESALGSEVASGAEGVNSVDDIDASMGIYTSSSTKGAEDTDQVSIADEFAKHNES